MDVLRCQPLLFVDEYGSGQSDVLVLGSTKKRPVWDVALQDPIGRTQPFLHASRSDVDNVTRPPIVDLHCGPGTLFDLRAGALTLKRMIRTAHM